MTVILEVRSKTEVAQDKARLLDKTGKVIANADKLHSLLGNKLYDWGVVKLTDKQQMFLFPVLPEQKSLRFRLAESPIVILDGVP